MPDDDLIDGCSVPFAHYKETKDEDIDALVLFADVDFTDPAAVEARKAEWSEVL